MKLQKMPSYKYLKLRKKIEESGKDLKLKQKERRKKAK
jgi:hypothetical protein